MTAVSSDGELAVIILEKLAFSDTNLDAQIQQISTAHKLIQQNDVYHVLLSDGYEDGDKAAESQKTTVIYPATQKHVDKVSAARLPTLLAAHKHCSSARRVSLYSERRLASTVTLSSHT